MPDFIASSMSASFCSAAIAMPSPFVNMDALSSCATVTVGADAGPFRLPLPLPQAVLSANTAIANNNETFRRLVCILENKWDKAVAVK